MVYSHANNAFQIQVEFPDGIRFWPAELVSEDIFTVSDRPVLLSSSPVPNERWEFRKRIGGKTAWVAYPSRRLYDSDTGAI